MRRVRNRYAEVALTYTRPWYMILWAGFIGFFVFAPMLLPGRKIDYGAQIAYLIIGGTIAAWGGAIIAGHAKEQLADARARLTPNFRAPHLIVAATVFALGVIGFAAFIVLHIHGLPVVWGWPPVTVTFSGYLALVLLAAAAMAWSSLLQSASFILLSIGAGVLLVSPAGMAFTTDVLAGRAPIAANVIIIVAIEALLALGCRLAGMHEGMREYWRLDPSRALNRPQATGDLHHRRGAAAETGPFNAFLRAADRLDTVRNVFAAPFWTRVRHWRRGMGLGRVSWLGAAVFPSLLLLVHYFQDSSSTDDQNFIFIVMPALLSMTMPLLFTATMWPQRWNMLAVESLRPVGSRRRLFSEQGVAMAADLATTWTALTTGAFLPTLLLRPTWLVSPTIAGILLMTAAGQIWLFAVCVWALRHRDWRWLGFFTFIGSLMAMGILLGRLMDGPKGTVSTPPPWIAAAIALLGLIIAWDAYRRWLRTDLD